MDGPRWGGFRRSSLLLPAPAERRGLGGDVDADRAPDDAPATADAAGGSELVVPGTEFVGHPLAVSAGTRASDTPTVDVGEVEVEAGVPAAPPRGVLPGEIRHVLCGRAEAGGADQRAVTARQAPGSDIVPMRRFACTGEDLPHVCGHPPTHPPSSLNDCLLCLDVGTVDLFGRQFDEHLRARLAAHPDNEPMVDLVDHLGQRQVVAATRAGTDPHRRAEAGLA